MMDIPNNKEQIKESFEQILANFNTKYHLTITFPKFTSDKVCRLLLNRIIIHLNRRIFKKRYSKGQNFIKGFVVEERCFRMASNHFHILIGDDSGFLPDYERTYQLVESQVRYLGNDRLLNTDLRLDDSENSETNKIRMLCHRSRGDRKKRYIDAFQLQEYYNDGDNRLEKYLTKNFNWNTYSIEDAIGSIGFLGPSEVMFGSSDFAKY